MITILMLLALGLLFYNMFVIAVNLPMAIWNTWWLIAKVVTFVCCGFFILKFIWPKNQLEAYDAFFGVVSGGVGIVLTGMVFL